MNPRRQLGSTVFAAILLMCMQVDAQHAKRKVARHPPPPAATVRFVSGNSSLNIPFKSSSNLILVQARVNDSEPLWFIFDTGAESTVVDSKLAKQMRLKAVGKEVGTGTAGTATALIFRGVSIKLPNLEALNLRVAALPIDFISSPVGRKISGVIGNDIIKELVVEVDYESQFINLYEPQSYQHSGSGEVIPITIEENLPSFGHVSTLKNTHLLKVNSSLTQDRLAGLPLILRSSTNTNS